MPSGPGSGFGPGSQQFASLGSWVRGRGNCRTLVGEGPKGGRAELGLMLLRLATFQCCWIPATAMLVFASLSEMVLVEDGLD